MAATQVTPDPLILSTITDNNCQCKQTDKQCKQHHR